ncbi:MAG TPA: tRNA lysidine(34) synthetase TilS [Maribacter sp.]|nr:tRNA lysidine(34) synthetase TilS [Maribacter sp.]
MIRIIDKIPKNVTIACSGGIDSMVFTHFLLQGKRKVKLAHFNHDTIHSKNAQNFVEKYASDNNLQLIIGGVKGVKGKRSLEEFWRDERYDFFSRIGSQFVITCHHLDDCIETWIMSSLHGQSKLIPYKRGEIIFRPFLMTSKKTIKDYANRKNISWIEDPSNSKTNFIRNHTRINIVPQALIVNPGLRTTIRKKLIETYL